MDTEAAESLSSQHSSQNGHRSRIRKSVARTRARLSTFHDRIPYLRHLPLPCILIIGLLIFINLLIWAVCGIILAFHEGTGLLGTAALAYSLGLRHALDADHISAIDLMTRRLIATGQRPVTVGTFFSLGHSTVVIVTSIVVAATAAGVSKRFDGFGNIGGIIGTSVSAAFLILLGLMNGYILYRLIVQIKHVIRLQPHEAENEAWKIQGGGCLFHVLKRMFKLIDRPWKMYPLGVMFGLGFDTSSEIALLGISSIQGAKGTNIWLIMIFPILFTAGMCLLDTTDGALMMGLYIAPMRIGGNDKKRDTNEETFEPEDGLAINDQQGGQDDQVLVRIDTARTEESPAADVEAPEPPPQQQQQSVMTSAHMRQQVKDPLIFLYYSIVLTVLTVICAIVIGIIQLLSLILNVAHPGGRFWDGVEKAGDNYDIIGGSICGSFIVAGIGSVLCYRPWMMWVDRKREALRREREEGEGQRGRVELVGGVDDGRDGRFVVSDGEEDGAVEELVEVYHDGKADGRQERAGRQGQSSSSGN